MSAHPWRTTGGFTSRRAGVGLPAGVITEFRLGQLLSVYGVYEGLEIFSGKVVHIIEAGEKPDPAALEHYFRVSKMATALKQPTIPARVSRYKRLIIEGKSGRAFAFPVNPVSHQYYPEGALRK